jgi:acetoacetate decarboxylase
MSYPPAPWTLKGFAYQTVHLIDIAKASPHVPIGLEIVSVVPGKTIGGVYIAQYNAGSTLLYNELIVVAAIVRRSGKLGSWISHIYVDHPDSIQGGREIWGLPKEFAEFHWRKGDQGGVVVKQGDSSERNSSEFSGASRILCDLNLGWQFNLWRQSGQALSYSQLGSELLMFEASAAANLAIVSAQLEIPNSSPFSRLIDSQPWLTVKAEGLDVRVGMPGAIAPSTKILATNLR